MKLHPQGGKCEETREGACGFGDLQGFPPSRRECFDPEEIAIHQFTSTEESPPNPVLRAALLYSLSTSLNGL